MSCCEYRDKKLEACGKHAKGEAFGETRCAKHKRRTGHDICGCGAVKLMGRATCSICGIRERARQYAARMRMGARAAVNKTTAPRLPAPLP